MFSKTHGLILLTLLLLLLSVSSVCAADNVSVVNVSDNVSGNISETNVSESNVSANATVNVSCSEDWTAYYDSEIVVNQSELTGSHGDIINFTASVEGYRYYIDPDSLINTRVYFKHCQHGYLSLYENDKPIKTVNLSKDNDGAAFFSFKFKADHRYRLVYHGYSSPYHGFWPLICGESYYYGPSSKDLNIKIVHRLFDNY